MVARQHDDEVIVSFSSVTLPAGTGIRTTLRHYLIEHRGLFRKAAFRTGEGNDMELVVTLHETLTRVERDQIEADIKKVVEIFSQLADLKIIK